jgi:hypothetical protein
VKPSIRRIGIVAFLFSGLLHQLSAFAADWLPVTADELKMTEEPKAPGAAAIYLYTQVDRDDTDAAVYHYARLKVLTAPVRLHQRNSLTHVEILPFRACRSAIARIIPDFSNTKAPVVVKRLC